MKLFLSHLNFHKEYENSFFFLFDEDLFSSNIIFVIIYILSVKFLISIFLGESFYDFLFFSFL